MDVRVWRTKKDSLTQMLHPGLGSFTLIADRLKTYIQDSAVRISIIDDVIVKQVLG